MENPTVSGENSLGDLHLRAIVIHDIIYIDPQDAYLKPIKSTIKFRGGGSSHPLVRL
jgi:hypothetical protein